MKNFPETPLEIFFSILGMEGYRLRFFEALPFRLLFRTGNFEYFEITFLASFFSPATRPIAFFCEIDPPPFLFLLI